MSELLGGNNQGPNEDDQFHFGDLDSEWEAFSKSLEKTPEQELEEYQFQQACKIAHDEVTQRIEELNITHVIAGDPQVQEELYHDFTNRYFERKCAEYEQFGGAPEEDDEFLRYTMIECVQEYFREREFQVAVFNSIMRLRVVLSQDASQDTIDFVHTQKKQIQAEMMVMFQRGLEDEWHGLVKDMLPGDNLDLSKAADIFYIALAKIHSRDFQQAQEKKLLILAKAKEIIGIDDHEDPIEVVAQATMDLLNMNALACEPVYTEAERSNRNAKLWEWSREIQLGDELARKLVDLFDTTYPITADPGE